MSSAALPDGFVYLDEVCDTIVASLRYVGPENMTGRPLAGYHKNRVICTRACALRLAQVQKILLHQHRLCLVVYDAYRPRKAVEDLFQWSQVKEDPTSQVAQKYYPQYAEDKTELFRLGYIVKSSNHCRGSTVDVTLCDWDKRHLLAPYDQVLTLQHRVLVPGEAAIPFLDDGTMDMGSSFDLFSTASHPNTSLVREPFASRRRLLQNLMTSHGFVVSDEEWWHFWLRDEEPFPRDEINPEFGFDVDVQ